MKIFQNQKAQGIAYAWLYGLISLFSLGVVFIIFDQIFLAHLNPIIVQQVNSSNPAIDEATKTEIFGFIDNYMAYWHMLPFVLILVVIVYMFVVTIRKERNDENF